METKTDLISVLGLNVFELLFHEGMRSKYEKAKLEDYLRQARERFELSQVYVVAGDLKSATPVFDEYGKLLYFNVPLKNGK
jgi:hypothetical protein